MTRLFPSLTTGAALLLAACGEKPAAPPPPPPPPPAEIRSPAPATVTLPRTGEITTGSFSPSTPVTRIPGEAEQARAVNGVVNGVLNQVKEAQAAALKNARVAVNAAWPYAGYSTLAPDPAAALPARLVAVDVTISGHTAAFDPDDIEIVDGITAVSYGSDPHLTILKGPGEALTDPREAPAAPQPLRLLLIYAFPKGTPRFTLYYWGQKLLPEPRGFDAVGGWSLPYPDKAAPGP